MFISEVKISTPGTATLASAQLFARAAPSSSGTAEK